MVYIDPDLLWIVIVGFIIAFVVAFGIGANDVANSFGPSVGAKVISLRKACIIAAIFNLAGSVLIGFRVSDTIRKGIVDVDIYTNGSEKLLMLGNLSALSGSCIWLLLATLFKLPVSGTHSIVGAIVGFSLVAKGSQGINWFKLGMTVLSWFVSPILSGIISTLTFLFINYAVLKKEDQLRAGLILIPFIYGITAAINLFSIFYNGSVLLHFNEIPLYGVFILTFGLALLIAIFVQIVVVPRFRRSAEVSEDKEKQIDGKDVSAPTQNGIGEKYSVRDEKIPMGASDIVLTVQEEKASNTVTEFKNGIAINGIDSNKSKEITINDKEAKRMKARENVQDKPETARLFRFLQVLTATFSAFTHGGNDVSNAIGPIIAIWIVGTTGSASQKSETPIWILVIGGVGIAIGLLILGRRVMKTIGEDLTKITPTSGFCMDIGAALTVLIASNVKIPISTTHCKVGSVVMVGRVRSKEVMDWKLFINIIFAWIVTLPVSGGVSAAMMAILKKIYDL